MNNENYHGYLALAGISGYTSYLAGVEPTRAREMNRGDYRLAPSQWRIT